PVNISNMDYNLVLKTIPPYIASYVETHAPKVQLVYHNMLHTEQVVEASPWLVSSRAIYVSNKDD
ncbi:MAG: hypothetical protein V4685_04855, partial [Bacteroidota bacterium]